MTVALTVTGHAVLDEKRQWVHQRQREIFEDLTADYRYRAVISRAQVADTLREAVMSLDYDSHVKEVAVERSAPVRGREDAYYETWSALSKMQPTPPYGGQW